MMILFDHFKIICLRDSVIDTQRAATWFSRHWKIPADLYAESIMACITKKGDIPQWYLIVTDNQKIVAGAGVINNDFHNRQDLAPNLCALFVEESYRKKGFAFELLNFIRKDLGLLGYQKLYLVTDHTEFYEKCGWEFLTMVTSEDGAPMRMYTALTIQ